MNHRERLLQALDFKETDRVPIDFGGSVNTSIVDAGYRRLKTYLGVKSPSLVLQHPTRVVHVDEEILRHFDVDTRTVTMWAPRNCPDKFLSRQSYTDLWGVHRTVREGSSYFEITENPLRGEIPISSIRSHSWPDPDSPEHTAGLKEETQWIRENTDCAIVLYVPPPFIHISQYLRGMQDWFIDFALDTKRMEYLFDTILEITLKMAKHVLEEVGKEADVVTCSDDIGGQNGLLISKDDYLRFIKPRHQRYFDQIHSLCDAKLLFHTCGDVSSIIDDLIAIGVDALNPVQVSASNMEPEVLKKRYGKRLVFWGGIDSSHLLPKGSPAEVQKAVQDTIKVLGEGGGYVLAAVHNIQPDVPPENIEAMIEAGLGRT